MFYRLSAYISSEIAFYQYHYVIWTFILVFIFLSKLWFPWDSVALCNERVCLTEETPTISAGAILVLAHFVFFHHFSIFHCIFSTFLLNLEDFPWKNGSGTIGKCESDTIRGEATRETDYWLWKVSFPKIFDKSFWNISSRDENVEDPIDSWEIFDLIRDINDPEHPYTLEQLNVVQEELIRVFIDEEETFVKVSDREIFLKKVIKWQSAS